MELSLKVIRNVLLYSEILAAIAATIFFFKYKKTSIKYLLLVLWLIVLTEQFGLIMGQKRILLYENKYNYWIFNIMKPIWKLLYLYIFYKSLENMKYKKWIRNFIAIYIVSLIINWLFLQNFLTEIESYSHIIGAFFIISSAIFYLLELLKSDKIIRFYRKLLFWVSIGLLIFYGGTIPFIIVRDYYANLNYIHNIYLIIYLLGTLMYLLFTFGFIWSKKE